MPSQAAVRKKGLTPSVLAAATAAALAHTLGRSACSVPTALSLGGGGGSAPKARSLGRGGGSAAVATRPITGGIGKGSATAPSSIDGSSGGGGFPSPSSSMDGFLFLPSPSPAWWDTAGSDPSSSGFGRSAAWDGSWDKDPRPPGGFMSYSGSQPEVYTSDSPRDIINIMQAYVILHNMIVEDKKDSIRKVLHLNKNPSATIVFSPEVHTNDNPDPTFAELFHRNSAIKARPIRRKLKKDLTEHIWQRYRNKKK